MICNYWTVVLHRTKEVQVPISIPIWIKRRKKTFEMFDSMAEIVEHWSKTTTTKKIPFDCKRGMINKLWCSRHTHNNLYSNAFYMEMFWLKGEKKCKIVSLVTAPSIDINNNNHLISGGRFGFRRLCKVNSKRPQRLPTTYRVPRTVTHTTQCTNTSNCRFFVLRVSAITNHWILFYCGWKKSGRHILNHSQFKFISKRTF